MADYTKLIELKVKDTDLGRALKKLTTSLDRIERKLDKIGTKSFKGVTSSAEKAAKSIQRVERATNNFASVSKRARLDIAKTAIGVTSLSHAASLLDKSLRRVKGPLSIFAGAADGLLKPVLALKTAVLSAAAAHPLLATAALAGAGAYTIFGSKIFDIKKNLTGFVNNLKTAEKAVRKFVLQIKDPGKSELTIFDRIQSAKGGGLVGLRKLLDQVTAAQAKLISTSRGYVAASEQVRAVEKALNAELMARKRIMDQIIIGEQRRTPTSSLTAAAGEAGGLEGLRTLLAEAQGIQDRMLTTNENYKVASARVKNIQKAINQELRQRELIMGKINIKEEKSITLGERLRGLAGNVGGRVAREARPGRAMERRGLMVGTGAGLAGLGMVQNTGIGQFMGNVAVNPAMGGLKNAANLAMAAHIPGAGIAAKGVADTKMALVGLGAAAKTAAGFALLDPRGVALLASAWLVFGNKGIRGAIEKLIGAERAAKKTTAGLFGFAKVNPFLSRLNTKLEISKDTTELLGEAARKAKRELAALGDPGMKTRVQTNVSRSQRGRAGSGFAAWESKTQTQLAAKKSLDRKNKRLEQQGKKLLEGEQLITKELKKQNLERDKANKKMQKQVDAMFTDKARRERRMGARIRKMGSGMGMNRLDAKGAESLMLGAGFPLLFGGGLGATGGGIAGSVLGNAMGMGGFGTQIIGSAIGTMLETLVMKANQLGETLKTLNMEELAKSGVKVNTQLALQIDKLKEIGNIAEARRLVEIEIFKATGALPGTHESIARSVKGLGDAWNKVSTTIGTTLGILATPFMAALSKILDMVNAVFSVINGIISVFTALERSIGELVFGSSQYRTHMWESSEAGKQARIEAERKLRIVKEEMLLAGKILRINLKKPLGNTIEDRKELLEADYEISVLNADKKLQAALKKITMDKDQGGEGIDPNSPTYNTRTEAIYAKYEHSLDQALKTRTRGLLLLDLEATKTKTIANLNIANLTKQKTLNEKINAAKLAGDTDTVKRLQVEAQILQINSDLQVKLLEELTVEQRIEAELEAQLKIRRLLLDSTTQLTEEQQKLKAAYEQIGNTIKSGIVDAIESAVEGTKTLGEVASQVLRQIAKQILTSGVNSFFNNWGKKNQGNWIGAMFGSFGNFGGKKAKGGPVTGGTSYLVGEKGPELFTPKSSGHITANDGLGGSVINVSVDASGSSAEGDADKGRELGRMLGAAIQAELLKQQRPGGILSR